MSNNNTVIAENPAVVVAKADNMTGQSITLSTGIKGTLHVVSASLIQDVMQKIKMPDVPKWYNPDKDREEDNPTDPDYLKAIEQVTSERASAATDAIIMFGLELADEVPQDDTWIKKLKYFGIEVNTDDQVELEFAYKKYIACGSADLIKLGKLAGIADEAVAEAVESFRG